MAKRTKDEPRPDAPGQLQIPEIVEAASTPEAAADDALGAIEKVLAAEGDGEGEGFPSLVPFLAEYRRAAGAVSETARQFIEAGVGGRDAMESAMRLFDILFND